MIENRMHERQADLRSYFINVYCAPTVNFAPPDYSSAGLRIALNNEHHVSV
jgi:hypothetical protein